MKKEYEFTCLWCGEKLDFGVPACKSCGSKVSYSSKRIGSYIKWTVTGVIIVTIIMLFFVYPKILEPNYDKWNALPINQQKLIFYPLMFLLAGVPNILLLALCVRKIMATKKPENISIRMGKPSENSLFSEIQCDNCGIDMAFGNIQCPHCKSAIDYFDGRVVFTSPQELEQYRQQRQEQKAFEQKQRDCVICPYCRTEVRKEVKLCPTCGAEKFGNSFSKKGHYQEKAKGIKIK